MKISKLYQQNTWTRVGQVVLFLALLVVTGLMSISLFTPAASAAELAASNQGLCETKTSQNLLYTYDGYITSYECMWRGYDVAYESSDGWGYGRWSNGYRGTLKFRVNEWGRVEVWNGYWWRYRYYLY